MLSKIFLAVLSLSFLGISLITFYSYSWLSSIGDPRDAFMGFDYYIGISWSLLWVSSIILLILANVILWQSRKSWAMWLTLGYFSLFVLLRYFWLGNAGHNFLKTLDPADNSYNFNFLWGIVFVFLAALIVYFNQYLNLRLSEKMYGQDSTVDEAQIPSEQPELEN